MDDQLRIDVIEDAHAGELLTVRRAAFVTEAQLYGDPHIPALTQTLEELRTDLARPDVVTLGAWAGTRLVGSVRVGLEEDRALLGRLAVVPDLQKRGIGTRLLMTTSAAKAATNQGSKGGAAPSPCPPRDRAHRPIATITGSSMATRISLTTVAVSPASGEMA